MRRTRQFLAVCILTALLACSAAAQDVEHRPWSEALVVVGKKVGLSLPRDAYVEGKALGHSQDGLIVDAEVTTRPDLYPAGRVHVPRSEITMIQVWDRERSGSQAATMVIGTAAAAGGLLGGLFGFGMIGGGANGIGDLAAATGIRLGAAALGAIIGRKLDSDEVTTLIRIIPEPGDISAGAPDQQAAPVQQQYQDTKRAANSSTEDSPSLSGKKLIRRGASQAHESMFWPVVPPNRSRSNWAF